jgi:hypothetical protein
MPDALAIEQLVRDHVTPGQTTLGELGALLECAKWLRDEDVSLVTALTGKLPVPWSNEDTVAAIALPDGSSVLYLALLGKLEAGEISVALRGEAQDTRVSGVVVRAAALA